MLDALEVAARDLDHQRVRLDSKAATWQIYATSGYREIADYNNNPHADHSLRIERCRFAREEQRWDRRPPTNAASLGPGQPAPPLSGAEGSARLG